MDHIRGGGIREEPYQIPRGVSYTLAHGHHHLDTSRGYTSTKEQLQKRLKRVEGQVRGVEKMVEDDRYCIDVLTQISAIQAALDKVALGLMDDHARHCVIGGPRTSRRSAPRSSWLPSPASCAAAR